MPIIIALVVVLLFFIVVIANIKIVPQAHAFVLEKEEDSEEAHSSCVIQVVEEPGSSGKDVLPFQHQWNHLLFHIPPGC